MDNRARRSGIGADPVIGAEWLRLIEGMKSVGATRRFGRRVAPFNGFDDRRESIGHIQGASLTSENVIAQGAQDLRQIAEQYIGGRVFLALAVAANHRDELVSSGALRVEVVEGLAGWIDDGRR